ncbi:LPXTG cell wall anchor domain-containing protein [Actinoplanes sp. NPDC049118]|uniref:LPXTG cell wall anchor domain-containing protein n=1 Tax=Actinoplanes sp. NPDC049118 TaxID=3155769 RepID=UPI00340CDF62
MRRALHRLLTGSAVALLAAAVVAAPGTPASAADPAVRLHFPDISVVGKDSKTSALFAWVDVPGTAPAAVGKATVSVDTADVDDIVTVEAFSEFEEFDGDSCGRAGTVITCEIRGPIELEAGTNLLALLALSVTAKPGAAQDAEGKLAFTARFDGGPAVTSQSTVNIGEGVDLAGVVAKPVTVAPGARVVADLRVANVGTRPVKGVVLVMVGWDPSLTEGGGFSNCTYGLLTVCTFDDELATGTSYELSTPMGLEIPADAAAGSRASAVGGWYTPSDFKELIDLADELDDEVLGPKGTGAPAELRVAPAKKGKLATRNQVDTDLDNNLVLSEFVVGGDRHPDLAAIGATVAGTAGDKVRTKVGFVNNGPGTLYHRIFDNVESTAHILVPAGLRATEADDDCLALVFDEDVEPEGPGKNFAGASEYLCFTDRDKTEPKASTLFDFTFEVRENASAEAGQVRINEDLFSLTEPLDRDARNDAAKITVQLSGGSGAGLPVTGANAGLVGAAGGALLLAGALGLLLVRRRRVRFTA